MRVQDLFASPLAIGLGIGLTKALPERASYWIARTGARSMARRRNHLFCTVRANLEHVLGADAARERVDAAAQAALQLALQTYVEMFRYAPDDYGQRSAPQVQPDPAEWELTQEALQDGRGILIAGLHISNFDLAAQWIASQGYEIQALSLPDPNAGTRAMNALRRHRGLVVTPANAASLRAAIRRLRNGGIVATGIDRPDPHAQDTVPFFGAPARLSSGYVRLALQAHARVIVAACIQVAHRRYHIQMTPLELVTTGDRREDVRRNHAQVLAVAEEIIRRAPEQWLMLVPVWEQVAR